MPPKASTSEAKLPIPTFIKFLTANVGLSPSDALSITAVLVKNGYSKAPSGSKNREAQSSFNPFVGLTESKLVSIGITDPDIRKVLCAYGRTGRKSGSSVSGGGASTGAPSAGKTLVADGGYSSASRKRKSRESDLDTPLPTKQEEKVAISLEFGEVEEDYLLSDRNIVVNRAPVMTAWATVVAERLGFTRQEALSVAHTYTNMNATSKGVSLGIYSPEKGKQRTEVGPSQPYVELLGRKIPVLALQNGEWRGIANGAIAEPEQAFGYIQRSFRQNMSAALGALKLLADSFDPDELNKIGYQLYAEFRPEVLGWGERGHLHLGKVLDLRRRPKEERTKEQSETLPDGQAAGEEQAALEGRVDEGENVTVAGIASTSGSPGKEGKNPEETLLDQDGKTSTTGNRDPVVPLVSDASNAAAVFSAGIDVKPDLSQLKNSELAMGKDSTTEPILKKVKTEEV